MAPKAISGLYYIAHIDNLKSILTHGILSHQQIETRGIQSHTIYNNQIVNARSAKKTPAPDGLSLWEYANVYFQPRNAMLFSLKENSDVGVKNLVILKVKRSILQRSDVWVTDGNAANRETNFYRYNAGIEKQISPYLNLEYWKDFDGSKRRIMAECLVPDSISPDWLECVFVARNGDLSDKVRDIVSQTPRNDIEVVVEPYMFFQPNSQVALTNRLSLAQGDMFFSQLQTLTISVNTIGVMGKGLASRAKYQFPEVYVQYQDLCRQRKLRTDQPVIVKSEVSLQTQLSETTPEDAQANWFLLFATKQHWKEDSKLQYILDGMKWLKENYKREGIKSLALPALGCGLGKLDWAEVGPIICTIAANFDIPVCVYLPAETTIPKEQRTADFLIRT